LYISGNENLTGAISRGLCLLLASCALESLSLLTSPKTLGELPDSPIVVTPDTEDYCYRGRHLSIPSPTKDTSTHMRGPHIQHYEPRRISHTYGLHNIQSINSPIIPLRNIGHPQDSSTALYSWRRT